MTTLLTFPYVLLDDNTGSGAPSALYTNPVEIIRADEPSQVADALLRLEAAGKRGLHAAGFFGYELGYVLEPNFAHLMPQNRTVPLLWFGLFSAPSILNGTQVESWFASQPHTPPVLTNVTHSWSGAEYEKRFDQVAEFIRAGDIYQMNLTFRARFQLEGSPVALYRELRQKQRVAYGAIIATGDLTVLSASPELFIEQSGRAVSTRPMKGTSPRGQTSEADDEARRVLATDSKQRAENLMIVDLMRNDLGRIADIGSVSVTDLFTVETFKTLHQMTSGVRATLKDGTSLAHLLEAIFPPGSVTGAPKIRAMELIAQLEDSPRGVYCGAIGRISPDGHSLFNVAIRTPVFDANGRGEMGIGSGVVADSVGSREYAECLLKMKFLTDKIRRFELIETMLYEPPMAQEGDLSALSSMWLLDGHLARLKASALHFGFRYDEANIRSALSEKLAETPRQRSRVRMLLADSGAVTITAAPFPAPPADQMITCLISPTRLNSADLFLRHKTTERHLYDREWQHYHDTVGVDEVIYLNQMGDLAEGSRTTIFIEHEGMLLTPPLTAGVLPGVLRADLLATGRARESRLTLNDLQTAEVFYLGNSLRGLQRATLTSAEPSAASHPW